MFSCKACKATQQTIDILQEQNKFLRELVQPRLDKPHSDLPMVEADAVLTNSGEQLDYSDREHQQLEDDLRERDRLLSGMHDVGQQS